jgi:hypothetical protein
MIPATAGRAVAVMAELALATSQSGPVGRLVLTDRQWRSEAVLGYCIALEHIRVAQPSDPRTTAMYCAQTLDNCRVGAVDVRAYFSAVVRHIKWLRSLPAGASLGLR